VRALPGVESAGVIDDIPLSGNGSHQPIALEAARLYDVGATGSRRSPRHGWLLECPAHPGPPWSRLPAPPMLLEASSGPDQPVLGPTFLAQPGSIGKRLTMILPDAVREVVGVVGDRNSTALDETRPAETLYMPLDQVSVPALGGWNSFPMSLVVRSASESIGPRFGRVKCVHEVDRRNSAAGILSMDDRVADSLSPQRSTPCLLVAFADSPCSLPRWESTACCHTA